ncbi:putative globin [Sulfurimonas gotlandica GD1]|uniref:Putative globin n=1 Tax=Sulfurimonas gotlandica (strain DSM 19862 / JCM 16533 / GD1) TaxID=929558 RepID=B6BLR1_SULGG|nr:globin domain-containing protein [Sulfurimonas gotlandica]EDZ62178.1 flavohemoprotein [Sulfurimonas gotlandica GD1]EHP28721.1 putative globin [Sulfurimonas gotlandica GD1]
MELSAKTIEIVKATAPIVAANAEAITSTMYKIMFTNHPEIKELFKDAKPDQHKKLAAAVGAYAANIDNLIVLEKAIEKMVSTHILKNVQPEHYPIVGISILEAIKKVLGDAVTLEVLDAWKEAYFFLAHVLIEQEKLAYADV